MTFELQALPQQQQHSSTYLASPDITTLLLNQQAQRETVIQGNWRFTFGSSSWISHPHTAFEHIKAMKLSATMLTASVLSLARRSSAFAPSIGTACRMRTQFSTMKAGPSGDGNPDRPKRISDDIEKMLLEQV
jgi:hypothetical protein